jgi:hypothetical protein
MFAELLSSFLSSEHGQNASTHLQQQGYPPDQINDILGAAVEGGAKGMHAATEGHEEPALGLFNIFGGHAGREFLTGAVVGLLRGDGIGGALKDGVYGALAGHIAEVIAQRTGMNQSVAGELAAGLAPFIASHAHDALSSHPAVVAQHGASPHHHKHHHKH